MSIDKILKRSKELTIAAVRGELEVTMGTDCFDLDEFLRCEQNFNQLGDNSVALVIMINSFRFVLGVVAVLI